MNTPLNHKWNSEMLDSNNAINQRFLPSEHGTFNYFFSLLLCLETLEELLLLLHIITQVNAMIVINENAIRVWIESPFHTFVWLLVLCTQWISANHQFQQWKVHNCFVLYGIMAAAWNVAILHTQSSANHKKLSLVVCRNSFNFSEKSYTNTLLPEMRGDIKRQRKQKEAKWIRKIKRTTKKTLQLWLVA